MRTIIAELCQNHNGDLSLMKEMVSAAAEAGATYAKVQSMLADDLSFRERFEEVCGRATGRFPLNAPTASSTNA